MARLQRSFAVVCILALALLMSTSHAQVLNRPVRVGCQMGKPPFTDARNRNISSTICDGLFADLFYLSMQRMSQPYTMTMVDDEEIEPYLEVNNATNTSAFDMFVAFHTITPARLRVVDFSVSMFQTQYRVGLQKRYHEHPAGLESAVLRKSVWYLLAVVSVMALGLGTILLVTENLEPNSELREMARWRRGLTAMEAGFETMMSGSTSLVLSHQVSRTVRGICAIMAMFVVIIFGAVITSQLTADSSKQKHTTLADLKGEKVAHASPALHRYLLNVVGPQVVEVNDIETFADEFYKGQRDDFAGYVAEDAVVAFLHNHHGGSTGGFTVSELFSHHGVVDLKAFVLSKLLPSAFLLAFNVQLEAMRQDGELATRVTAQVAPFVWPTPDDITVPEGLFAGIRAAAITMYAVFIAVGVGFYIADKLSPRPEDPDSQKSKYDEATNDDEKNHPTTGEIPRGGFSWRGKVYADPPRELLHTLDLHTNHVSIGDSMKETSDTDTAK